MHTKNGNRTDNKYRILQLNTSNCEFNSKLVELRATIDDKSADIIIVSESNSEVDDNIKMDDWQKAFPEYKFVDKLVPNNKRARCSLMIRNEIEYERLPKYQDTNNSSIAVRIRDGDSNWLHLLGIYRQWKLVGEQNAFDTKGIKSQVERLESQVKLIEKMCSENSNCVIGGDLNLDQCKQNDHSNRPELKALKPI